jgi:hypothetical protein
MASEVKYVHAVRYLPFDDSTARPLVKSCHLAKDLGWGI